MFHTKNTKDGHISIEPKTCPCCKTPIYTTFRYEKVVKAGLLNIENLKRKLQQQLALQDQDMVVKAMETDLAGYGSAKGKWFVCPNGHPYAIGECGGATQLSTCPDCKASIGGTGHQLVPGNKFAGHIDGAKAPKWTTMQ